MMLPSPDCRHYAAMPFHAAATAREREARRDARKARQRGDAMRSITRARRNDSTLRACLSISCLPICAAGAHGAPLMPACRCRDFCCCCCLCCEQQTPLLMRSADRERRCVAPTMPRAQDATPPRYAHVACARRYAPATHGAHDD